MRAVYFEEHGGPEVLQVGERPRPVPAPDQVLIEVHAAGVNPRDWMLRQGTYFAGRLVGSPPIIPGSDVSGVVAEAGSRVDGFSVGDEVVAMQSTLGRMGAYAEFMAVKASCVAHKPAGISHLDAAALPVAGLTAWQALFEVAKVGSGSAVTVVGGAGGVGHYATQLARWTGAQLTAVCGPANLDFVRELGAETAIDYTAEHFVDVVSEQALVFDTIGRESVAAVARTLARRGVHVSTVPNRQVIAATVLGRLRGRRRVAPVLVRPRQQDLTSLLQLMAAGDLRSVIAEVYPLAEAAEAQRRSRTFHTRGKLVLAVRDA
jgi:NADPH:quinone reductase-like Zn-dependent oxidoreductase